MVGIPGRSKGCHTCKRRKKGCDLQQPSCGQCKKACIPCEGYAPSLIFYHYDGRGKGTDSPVVKGTGQVQRRVFKPTAGSSELVLSSGLSRTAYESGLEGSFWQFYMPNRQCSALFDSTQRDLGGSISVIRCLAPDNSVLRSAMGAMALRAAANRDPAQQWMKQQGITMHITALQQVRRALSSRGKVSLEILGAARIFSLYEALYGGDWKDQQAQFRSWRAHHIGDLTLVTSNPPSSFATGPAHRLFVDGRLTHALCAIAARKRIILSEPAWMTEPWSHHPKTRKDRLIDILLELPALYEAVDDMNMQPDTNVRSSQRSNLRQMVSTVMGKLNDWRLKYATPTAGSRPDWQFPSSVTTDAIADAHIMTLYWATGIRAYGFWQILSGNGSKVDIDPDDCCRNIIHCLPLFLHPSTGIFRQHLVPFPVMTAARYLKLVEPQRLQEERAYLQSLCRNPDLTPMRQFMTSLQPQILNF